MTPVQPHRAEPGHPPAHPQELTKHQLLPRSLHAMRAPHNSVPNTHATRSSYGSKPNKSPSQQPQSRAQEFPKRQLYQGLSRCRPDLSKATSVPAIIVVMIYIHLNQPGWLIR